MSDTAQTETTDRSPARKQTRQRPVSMMLSTVLAMGFVALGFGIGTVLARTRTSAPEFPADLSPEAGFARDMSVHHTQGVDMADTIRLRTGDPMLRTLATDIVLTQQSQIGRFSAWLDIWGLPVGPTRDPMVWAGMNHPDGRMPGMATRDQVAALDTLAIAQAEVEFLRLMIAHHEGAVTMAQAVLPLTKRAEVTKMAQAVIKGQQREIDAMRALLTSRAA